MSDRRACPECGQVVPVTMDWKLYAHYAEDGGLRCPGSQQPTPRPEARRNTHGSRWRSR